MMVPKFANPHSLAQDVELTTRSEIAERCMSASVTIVRDEDSVRSLKRDLGKLLRDTWADILDEASGPSRTKKRRGDVAEKGENDSDGQLVFRLVSSMKRPQHISLDPKPPPPPVTREPDCEDDEAQAKVRRIRAQRVTVEFNRLGHETLLIEQDDYKPMPTEIKRPFASTVLPCELPPMLVTEEVRATRLVQIRRARETSVPSPHEPRPSCTVLPVVSGTDKRETQRKKRRKRVMERPPPAYWRPSPDQRGKCLGYALGYPSSWAPDQAYVRDTMKRVVETCHAVPTSC